MADFEQDLETEDPLAGDVDKGVHPDETRTDEQVAHDERYAVEPLDNEEDEGINPEDFEKETINPYIITLEKEVKERALGQGISEADAAKIDGATFLLKDSEGKPTDTLQVAISRYKGMYSRPGVQGFYLRPVNVQKDTYGRDAKFVRGSFWGGEQSSAPGAFSMYYAGGPFEAMRQYADSALQPDSLARADLIELKVPAKTA